MQYSKRWTILFLLLALALAAPLTSIAEPTKSVATIELSTKTVDKAIAYVGDELVYTIVLENSGMDPMDLMLRDALPSGVDYVSHTVGDIVPDGGGTGSGSMQGPYLVWIGTLNGGSTITLTLTVRVNNTAVAGEDIVNEAGIWIAGSLVMPLSAETAVHAEVFLPIVMNAATVQP